jgi:hypothetical protein
MAKKKYLSALKSGVVDKSKKIYVDQSIKGNIKILEELKNLIFPLADEEHSQLEQNILKEGCRDPLVVWQNEGSYILVDGHNRYGICKKHSLDFKVTQVHFENLEGAKDWMINNQLGRRNVTSEQASWLRGIQYDREKQRKGGHEKVLKSQNLPKGQNDLLVENTYEKLSKEHNVSPKTIQRDAQFAKGLEKIGVVNPGLKQEILKGKTKVSKADVQALSRISNIGKIRSADDISAVVSKKKSTSKEALTKGEKEGKIKVQQQKLLFHAQKLKDLGLNKREIKGLIDGL